MQPRCSYTSGVHGRSHIAIQCSQRGFQSTSQCRFWKPIPLSNLEYIRHTSFANLTSRLSPLVLIRLLCVSLWPVAESPKTPCSAMSSHAHSIIPCFCRQCQADSLVCFETFSTVAGTQDPCQQNIEENDTTSDKQFVLVEPASASVTLLNDSIHHHLGLMPTTSTNAELGSA